MRNHVRHVRAAKGVHQKDQRHDHHRQSQHATGRFEQQGHANQAGVDIHRGGLPWTRRQLTVEDKQIGRAKSAHEGKDPVSHRNAIARRALKSGVGHIGQKHGKRQVNRPGFGVIENQNRRY